MVDWSWAVSGSNECPTRFRGVLSSAVQATGGLARRVISWITSSFRETKEPPQEDDEDKEEGKEEPTEGEAEPEAAPEEDAPAAEPDNEEHAMWEEKYKSHHDDKPNGKCLRYIILTRGCSIYTPHLLSNILFGIMIIIVLI